MRNESEATRNGRRSWLLYICSNSSIPIYVHSHITRYKHPNPRCRETTGYPTMYSIEVKNRHPPFVHLEVECKRQKKNEERNVTEPKLQEARAGISNDPLHPFRAERERESGPNCPLVKFMSCSCHFLLLPLIQNKTVCFHISIIDPPPQVKTLQHASGAYIRPRRSDLLSS